MKAFQTQRLTADNAQLIQASHGTFLTKDADSLTPAFLQAVSQLFSSEAQTTIPFWASTPGILFRLDLCHMCDHTVDLYVVVGYPL